MGHKKGDPKQKQHAALMKEQGIRRKTGACPWGCGSSVPNGGPALITHLSRCTGKSRR